MAEKIRSSHSDDDEPHLDLRPLMWLGGWGGGACLALIVAVLVSRTEFAEQRADGLLAAITGTQPPHALRAAGAEMLARAEAERETRRTQEAIRILAADRDRLAQRLALLERSLQDLTGALKRPPEAASGPAAPPEGAAGSPAAPAQSPPVQAPAVPAPSAAASAPTVLPSAPAPTGTAPAPAQPPAHAPAQVTVAPTPAANLPAIRPEEPRPAAAEPASSRDAAAAAQANAKPPARSATMAMIQAYASSTAVPEPELSPPPTTQPSLPPPATQAKPEFAVDLGGATSVNGIRALWDRTRARQPVHLGNQHPLISVREGGKPGRTELRLEAGPIANVGAAARLCATLVAAGVPCQTAVFDGQRLAQR